MPVQLRRLTSAGPRGWVVEGGPSVCSLLNGGLSGNALVTPVSRYLVFSATDSPVKSGGRSGAKLVSPGHSQPSGAAPANASHACAAQRN